MKCTVAGEPVLPQPGDFYGGCSTRSLTGPSRARRAWAIASAGPFGTLVAVTGLTRCPNAGLARHARLR